jgi:hypothetical protein
MPCQEKLLAIATQYSKNFSLQALIDGAKLLSTANLGSLLTETYTDLVRQSIIQGRRYTLQDISYFLNVLVSPKYIVDNLYVFLHS